jgi:BirA family biotin operon repressor/biotin-[acetyl-CoA-carboxylase] ligase
MEDRSLVTYTRSGGWLGRSFRYVRQVGSTNDVVLRAGREGAPEGLVVAADEQTAGRGRVQRRWAAPVGTSLLLSMLFRPQKPFAYTASRITMACGLALRDSVLRVAGVETRIKWPNDLIVDGAEEGWYKAAGMLSEIGMSPASQGGEPAYLVVGIGLNVNVPADVLPTLGPNAVSLSVLCGHQVDRSALLDALLMDIEQRHAALICGIDPLAAWQRALAWIGEKVEVHPAGSGDKRLLGRAVGVDDEGALLLRLSNGEIRRFSAGDVSLRQVGG